MERIVSRMRRRRPTRFTRWSHIAVTWATVGMAGGAVAGTARAGVSSGKSGKLGSAPADDCNRVENRDVVRAGGSIGTVAVAPAKADPSEVGSMLPCGFAAKMIG